MTQTMTRLMMMVLTMATLTAHVRAEISLSNNDTFSGDAAGWRIGKPPGGVSVVAGGGPAGASDAYLQVVSTGQDGPGGRPIVFNREQWSGNYVAANVHAVEMDLINSGNAPLAMRLALRSTAEDEAPSYVMTNAYALPNDNQWHHAIFPLTAAGMTVQFADDTFTFDELIDSVGELRLLHNADVEAESVPLAATFGVDNVHAIVPEPTSFVLTLVGLVSMLAFGRRSMQ